MRGLKTSAPPPGRDPRPASLQGQQGVGDVQPGPVGEMGHLHRGEGLEVHPGAQPFNAPEHLQVKGKGQVRMATAHDVDLGDGFVAPGLDPGEDLLQGHLVGPRLSGLAAKGAELAAVDANVGVVEVLVIDVIGPAAVEPLAHHLGQGPHPQQIGALEQGQAVFPVQPDLCGYLVIDGPQIGVLKLGKGHPRTPL